MSVLGGLGNGIGFMTGCSSVRSSRLLRRSASARRRTSTSIFSARAASTATPTGPTTPLGDASCAVPLHLVTASSMARPRTVRHRRHTPRPCNGQDRPCHMHC